MSVIFTCGHKARDDDYDGSKNPYREGSPAYWAWAGWEAAVRVNAIKEVQRLGQEIQIEKD